MLAFPFRPISVGFRDVPASLCRPVCHARRTIITGTDEPVPAGPLPDYIIRPGWPYTDSLVPVPGYDIRILPASGILQTAIYWAVVGEMGKRLKP